MGAKLVTSEAVLFEVELLQPAGIQNFVRDGWKAAERAKAVALNRTADITYLSCEPTNSCASSVRDSTFCGKRKLRIIVPSFRKDPRKVIEHN